MGTGSLTKTDLNTINNIVQNTMLSFPKELAIGVLRDFFKQDSYYHYVADDFGFPKTVDHTDLPSDAGMSDDVTTRVYIGQKFRFDGIYYPAILVAAGSASYVPLSMNRERDTVQYEFQNVVDGYGNILSTLRIPSSFIFAGAWEGQLSIDVVTRGIRARDDLVELVAILFADVRFDEMQKSGVLIKKVSAGSPTETEDRNDKLFKQTVTLEVRTEWRRAIPIQNVVDAINICVDFGNLLVSPPVLAPNISISSNVQLLEAIQSL